MSLKGKLLKSVLIGVATLGLSACESAGKTKGGEHKCGGEKGCGGEKKAGEHKCGGANGCGGDDKKDKKEEKTGCGANCA